MGVITQFFTRFYKIGALGGHRLGTKVVVNILFSYHTIFVT